MRCSSRVCIVCVAVRPQSCAEIQRVSALGTGEIVLQLEVVLMVRDGTRVAAAMLNAPCTVTDREAGLR